MGKPMLHSVVMTYCRQTCMQDKQLLRLKRRKRTKIFNLLVNSYFIVVSKLHLRIYLPLKLLN